MHDALDLCAGALVLLFFLYFFLLRDALKALRARRWLATPCVILASGVQASDTDGLYRVDVAYRYEFGGRAYESRRYSFSGGSGRIKGFSAGRRSKEKVVERLAPGTRTVCWVDPEDPAEAVLERGFLGLLS